MEQTLSSASDARIYSGVKYCTWLQVLTLVQILSRELELSRDCIKSKIIKRYFNLFLWPLFNVHETPLWRETKTEKEGPLGCLCLYSQELRLQKSTAYQLLFKQLSAVILNSKSSSTEYFKIVRNLLKWSKTLL